MQFYNKIVVDFTTKLLYYDYNNKIVVIDGQRKLYRGEVVRPGRQLGKSQPPAIDYRQQ